MKWKCVFPDGTIEYLSPDEVTLIMSRCKLSNNAKQAEKIFQGENKTVCAWILCEEMIITGYLRKISQRHPDSDITLE